MKDSSLNRFMWLIGLVASALIFVSFGPLSNGTPDENASGATVAHWYNTHVNAQWATIWMVGLALFLILIFVSQLRTVLVESGGQRLWPNVAFASGIILIGGIIVAGSFEITHHSGVAQPRLRRGALRQLLLAEQRVADPRRR